MLVSAPDTGVIEWSRAGPLPEVCNADQVTRHVTGLIARYGSKRRSVGVLVAEQCLRMAQILYAKHLPSIAQEQATPGKWRPGNILRLPH